MRVTDLFVDALRRLPRYGDDPRLLLRCAAEAVAIAGGATSESLEDSLAEYVLLMERCRDSNRSEALSVAGRLALPQAQRLRALLRLSLSYPREAARRAERVGFAPERTDNYCPTNQATQENPT